MKSPAAAIAVLTVLLLIFGCATDYGKPRGEIAGAADGGQQLNWYSGNFTAARVGQGWRALS